MFERLGKGTMRFERLDRIKNWTGNKNWLGAGPVNHMLAHHYKTII